MAETITDVNGLQQYLDDYTLYALFVCRSRITPDYRDGLQPVTRKTVYGTLMTPGTKDGNVVKSAKIVGNVMGEYHPHGDQSIYGSMKPIANPFESNKPLLKKRGSWGNKYGDDPASMRYTEAGLSEFAQEVLVKNLTINSNCVDWIPNFDETTEEPVVLPAALPLLLINGAFGVGVGMKVEIPAHNINEVIDATIQYIQHPELPTILIPDHCMPCEIIDGNFEEICNLGIGSYTIRGIVSEDIVEGKEAIVIESAPDMTYYNSISKKVNEMVTSNDLIGIDNIFSDKNKLIITLKRGTDSNYVKQVLYRNTDLQKNCRVNFEVLNTDGNPIRLSYRSYLHSWLKFYKLTKLRIYYNLLQEVNTKIHEVEPYVKLAMSKEFDQILNLLRKNKNTDDSEIIEVLIKKLKITDIQAKYIINIRLKELSKGYFDRKIATYNSQLQKKADIMSRITNENAIEQDIVEELLYFKEKFGNKRRCKIISREEASGIPEGSFKIVVSSNNFIKKVPAGANITGSYKNDPIKFVIEGDNSKNVVIFNEMGKVFKLPIHRIPFSNKSSTGTDVRMLLKNCTSNIIAIIYEPLIEQYMTKLNKYFLVTLTAAGFIKKMDLDDFISANNSGLIYAKLDDGDYIKNLMIVNCMSNIVVFSGNHALQFPMESVPYLKRATKGNKSIASGDIDGMSVITNVGNDAIVAITKKGYVNKIMALALSVSDRCKRMSSVIKLGKGDYVVNVFGLSDNDSIQIITTSGAVQTIPLSQIASSTSVSTGTRLISGRGEEVSNVTYIKAQQ